jgi:glycosyltransferase involved in cell wall biosynthesis
MKLIVICGMSDDKVRASLLPLVSLEQVEEILLIRRSPLTMEKVKSYSPPAVMRWSLILAEIYRFFALFILSIKEQPTSIYAIYFVPHGIYAALVGRFLQIPVIHELIGTDRPKVTKRKCFQKLLSQGKRIGVRGTVSRDQLVSLGIPKEKFFISNAVNILDFELFAPGSGEKKFDLIYCGYMDYNKRVDIIIDAYIELQKAHPELTILLVGDGPERQKLESRIAQVGLQNQAVFVGKQSPETISGFLNQARIFVMASMFEGLPVAMIEALSCGLPVVMPDVGDIEDIATHDFNGLLFDQNHSDGMYDALSRLVGCDDLYQELREGALKTRERFIEDFTIAGVQRTWNEILNH